jgi:glycosyltransferase involved in cell wall biosynthesis
VAGPGAIRGRARRILGRVRRRLAGIRRRQEAPRSTYGPKPEVVIERTNFGPVVDQLVERLRRNQRRYGVNADYDLVREHFDHYQYLFQVPDLQERPDVDPIREFLQSGAGSRVSPDPNFSMQRYLARYPDKKNGRERSPYLEWLKRGKDAGEIADPAAGIEPMAVVLGLEPQQVVDEVVRIRTDVLDRLRSGVLGEMFAKAVEVEPLIGAAWPQVVARLKQVPVRNVSVARAAAAVYACHQAAGFRRAGVVIVTDRPVPNGPGLDRSLARALDGTIGSAEIVIIYTDHGGTSAPGRLPTGVREIDLASGLVGVEPEEQEQALVSLLRSMNADAIINWDSGLFYRAMVPFGRALADSERIFLHFSCNEQRRLGSWDGAALRWVYPAFENVAGIITDGEYLRDTIIEHYQLSDVDRERIHVFRTPASPELAAATPAHAARERPAVFWLGHRGRRSRIDLVIEVARRMPDVDFRLWHHEVVRRDAVGELPRNVTLEGRCHQPADLDLSGADAWLYTSGWDGVPELLLDVAMTEVPLVASLVGGVGELISERDAWPVAAWEDPEAYEKALRDVLADAVESRRRSHALRERLLRERTQEAYAQHAVEVLFKPTESSDGVQEEAR